MGGDLDCKLTPALMFDSWLSPKTVPEFSDGPVAVLEATPSLPAGYPHTAGGKENKFYDILLNFE